MKEKRGSIQRDLAEDGSEENLYEKWPRSLRSSDDVHKLDWASEGQVDLEVFRLPAREVA
jgi:hypothetical protein